MSIIAEANKLVNGERKEVYEGTDEIITGLWSAYLGIELTVLDYAALMILLKVARTKDKFHRDSWVDIAGYAEVGPRIWSASQPVSQERSVIKPRFWYSLADVPEDTRVVDEDGDSWWGEDSTACDCWGPFTEAAYDSVLDAK